MTTSDALSRTTVRRFYDRLGRWQDTQTFYEACALDALVRHGAFSEAGSILEVGMGTGRFAARLLEHECPRETEYVGIDVSPTMVEIARDRLSSYGDRVDVRRSDGGFSFEGEDGSVDRVVATYVLDLLSETDIRAFLNESHRLLRERGRLCLAGLTWGDRGLARFVSEVWGWLHGVSPILVGGCRPLCTEEYLDEGMWTLLHRESVVAWGVPSEVVVAMPA